MENYLENLLTYLRQYENMNADDLATMFSVSSNAKSKNYLLSKAMIGGYEGKEIAKAKFENYKINLKTIQLNEKGNPKEAMSFAPIDFKKIVNESWDTSDFKKYLSNDFLFFIFKEINGKNVFLRAIKWSVPSSDLNGEIKLVWENTKKRISEGTVIKEFEDDNKRKVKTLFLTERETNICHVRPHGSNGSDVAELPVPDRHTGYAYVLKQSFWFNHSYLKKIVNNNF